jgi:hypothetical protein
MKATAIFLAILLFALNFIPCKDAAAPKDAKAAVELPGAHNDSDKHDDDSCSPLCICSCCSVAPMPSPVIAVETIIERVHPVLASAYTDQLLDIALPIWQPPQLKA